MDRRGNLCSGDDFKKQQSSLRKKISLHKSSQAHLNIERIIEKSKIDIIPEHVTKLSKIDNETIEKIFRTAYCIAKNQRPYTDLPKLVDLQTLNGLEMGRILQSDKSCSSIVDHIAIEMRKTICKDIIEFQRKICVIVDESTSLSKKTMLVICLRTAIGSNEEIITFFFDIVELTETSAKSIKSAIITNLCFYGMNDEFLKKNLVAFVSDGASTMLGRIAGVGTQLQQQYPNIIVWHCLNHRLELAVYDTLKEINGTNQFQSFIEKLYALYHNSPKNSVELQICASSLNQRLLIIGKIFTIRWVASSEKTIKAVWNNYTTLHEHFSKASTDQSKNSKDRSKYLGLKKTLASIEFVSNLGIMYDALSELSDLSLILQRRSMSLSEANKCIIRTIRIFESMIDHPGPKTTEAYKDTEMIFKNVELGSNKAIPKIKIEQFFRSLANNLKSRLFTMQASNMSSTANNVYKDQYSILLSDLDILDSNTWPDTYDFQYGDNSVRHLAQQFQVDEKSSVRGFRELKEKKNHSLISDLKPLITAVNTIAISSSECERAFSSMNNIIEPKRNALSLKHISLLMFINCVGPPLHLFKPNPYILSWIRNGRRNADELCCPKRKEKTDSNNPYLYGLY